MERTSKERAKKFEGLREYKKSIHTRHYERKNYEIYGLMGQECSELCFFSATFDYYNPLTKKINVASKKTEEVYG